MDSHIAELKEELRQKELAVEERAQIRRANFAAWSDAERELCKMELEEAKVEVLELKRQLTTAVAAQCEIAAGERALPFGQRTFSQERTREMQHKLQMPLTREQISTRSAGRGGDVHYLETQKAIEIFRKIYQHEDATIEVRAPPKRLYDAVTNGKTVVCMMAVIRVTLANGVFHEDVGVSSNIHNELSEALKTASKSCVSDGIKRVLKHFGPALGSGLKDSDCLDESSAGNSNKKPRLVAPPMNNNFQQQQQGARPQFNQPPQQQFNQPQFNQQQPQFNQPQQQPQQQLVRQPSLPPQQPQPQPPRQQFHQSPLPPPPLQPSPPRQFAPITPVQQQQLPPPLSAASTLSAASPAPLNNTPPGGGVLFVSAAAVLAQTESNCAAAAASAAGTAASGDDEDYDAWILMEQAAKAHSAAAHSSSGGTNSG